MSRQTANVRVTAAALAFERFIPFPRSIIAHSQNFLFMFFTNQVFIHIIFSNRAVFANVTIKSFFKLHFFDYIIITMFFAFIVVNRL
jgi:hypothetical protein